MALTRTPDQTLTDQLAERFSERIRTRLLPAGARLPSVRACARQQGVSAYTVVAAYDKLLAQGLVEARRQRGFFVRDLLQKPVLTRDEEGLDVATFQVPHIDYDVRAEVGKAPPDGPNARFAPSQWLFKTCEAAPPVTVQPAAPVESDTVWVLPAPVAPAAPETAEGASAAASAPALPAQPAASAATAVPPSPAASK